MFVWNQFLEQTGVIKYENEQQLVSGLVSYQTPFLLETGTRFAVVRRDHFIRKSDETHRDIVDKLIVHFSSQEIEQLNNTGIDIEVGSTRIVYDESEYRATKVNNFGQPLWRDYLPIGVVEVTLERVTPLAY